MDAHDRVVNALNDAEDEFDDIQSRLRGLIDNLTHIKDEITKSGIEACKRARAIVNYELREGDNENG